MTSPLACRHGAAVIVALGLGAGVSAALPATAAALPVNIAPAPPANTDQTAAPARPARADVAVRASSRQQARSADNRAARRIPAAPVAIDTANAGHTGIPRRTPAPPARASAAQSSGLLGQLAALLNNQTPRMNPTQRAQSPTGVVTGALNAVDPDSPQLLFTVSAQPDGGSATVAADGTWTYIPDPAHATTGVTDTFEVQVSDAPSGFAIHGLAGLLHLLSFGLLGTRGDTSTSTVSVTATPFTTGGPGPDPPDPSDPPDPPRPGTGHMAVGMNLENVVDWSPAWTFTDAFQASRPWISQAFNPQTFGLSWEAADAPTLDLDSDGNVRSLKTWTHNGVAMRQFAGTLMFNGLGGGYADGIYHAEWDGTGVVSFGFDAQVTASGRTAAGRNFADLQVTPTDSGIYLRIEETAPGDPVRDFNVWMPDYDGRSFVGQRWQPGAAFSPFHPLFLERLAPFGTLRFMAMQETNSSDIATWSQRRDADDIRQGSGSGGTPSEPTVNGVAVEYLVELANELDADPWFNMPHQADDTFVRNFATYVRDHLEPDRAVYVEWSNEIWNFGWGFEASAWVAEQARAAGLDPDFGQWIVAGREAKRDLDIWSEVFAGQSERELIRVAAGWAAVSWVTDQVLENMGGSFDAIAIAPYITPTDEQRAGYTAATTVDRVIADTRTNVETSVGWTRDHEQLAADWSARLGRPVQLVAYEGGAHLDGRNGPYQNAFYAASNDPRMGDIYRDYLTRLDAAGMDVFMDFQFTGQPGAASWGDFAKLHRMNESLSTAYRYNAVVSAADGSLWDDPGLTG